MASSEVQIDREHFRQAHARLPKRYKEGPLLNEREEYLLHLAGKEKRSAPNIYPRAQQQILMDVIRVMNMTKHATSKHERNQSCR